MVLSVLVQCQEGFLFRGTVLILFTPPVFTDSSLVPSLSVLSSNASKFFKILHAADGTGDLMRFAGAERIPLWLALTFLAANITLHALNFY